MAIAPGLGTVLKNGAATVGQVVSISGPSLEVGTVETTNLASTKREYIPTIAGGGEVTFEVEWDEADASHTGMFSLWDASPQADSSWSITFTDTGAAVYTFDAILTGLEISGMEVDERVTASVTLQITGDVVVT